jgi:hypothetical protein
MGRWENTGSEREDIYHTAPASGVGLMLILGLISGGDTEESFLFPSLTLHH